MGSDKGLLRQAEESWAEIAAAKLSSLQMNVVISVNNEQFEDYSRIFPSDRLIVDDDESISVKGPLLGLLTVHQDDPTEDLLVLACDMVNVNELILRRLVDACSEGLYDAYVYKTKDVSQPLCAVYSSTALKDLYWRYQHNGLKKFSMMYVLDSMNVRYLPVEASFEDLFDNYNSPESC